MSSTLRINLNVLNLSLSRNTTYNLQILPNFVIEAGALGQPNITYTIPFTTDNGATLVSRVPDVNATNVGALTAFSLVFNREVRPGNGNIYLYNNNGPFSRVLLTTLTNEINGSNSHLNQNSLSTTFTVTYGELLNANDNFTIEIEEGAFIDRLGVVFEGATWSFSTQEDEAPFSIFERGANIQASASLSALIGVQFRSPGALIQANASLAIDFIVIPPIRLDPTSLSSNFTVPTTSSLIVTRDLYFLGTPGGATYVEDTPLMLNGIPKITDTIYVNSINEASQRYQKTLDFDPSLVFIDNTTSIVGSESIRVNGGTITATTFTDSFDFGTTDNFTYETFFKCDNTSGDNYMQVIPSTYIVDNNIKCFVEGAFTLESTINVRDGNWHFVALVRNNNILKLFVDGYLEATYVEGSNFAPIDSFSSSQFGGKATVGNLEPLSSNFVGNMDQLRISNSARYDTSASVTAYEHDLNSVLLIKAETTIEDSSGVAPSIYTYDIYPSTFGGSIDPTTIIEIIDVTGTNSQDNNVTKTFDPALGKLSLTGRRPDINLVLDYISLETASDYDGNFIMVYQVTTPHNNQSQFESNKTKSASIVRGTPLDTEFDLELLSSPFGSQGGGASNGGYYSFRHNHLLYGSLVTDFDQGIETYQLSVSINTGGELCVASTLPGWEWYEDSVEQIGTSVISSPTDRNGISSFADRVLFLPNGTGDVSVTVSLLKNGTQIYTSTNTISHYAKGALSTRVGPGVLSYQNNPEFDIYFNGASTTWTVSYIAKKYCVADYLIVAPGGGAGREYPNPNLTLRSAGGGAGNVITGNIGALGSLTDDDIALSFGSAGSSGVYTLSGGVYVYQPATAGNNASITYNNSTITALGGQPGNVGDGLLSVPSGGNSGSNQLGASGFLVTSGDYFGGAGGGAGGPATSQTSASAGGSFGPGILTNFAAYELGRGGGVNGSPFGTNQINTGTYSAGSGGNGPNTSSPTVGGYDSVGWAGTPGCAFVFVTN